jgi:hypothetical protein
LGITFKNNIARQAWFLIWASILHTINVSFGKSQDKMNRFPTYGSENFTCYKKTSKEAPTIKQIHQFIDSAKDKSVFQDSLRLLTTTQYTPELIEKLEKLNVVQFI